MESTPVRLSRRELEVAGLVAEGLTNREIARRLFISERTVDGHLEHVREKLAVSTRAQIAAWVVRQGRSEVGGAAPSIDRLAAGWRRIARQRTFVVIALVVAVALSGAVVSRIYSSSPAISSGGIITTIAGTESPGDLGGYTGDGGLAIHAELSRPTDVVAGPDGSIYIADYGNRVVRRIRNGTIATVAGGGTAPLAEGTFATSVSLGYASNLAVDTRGNLYLLTNVAGILEVWMVRADSTVTRVASLGASRGGGPPASFLPVGGLTVAQDGTLYIADRAENRVWKRSLNGQLAPYAGTGQAGYSPDGGAATGSRLNWPIGLATDQQGNLYIADSGNNRIRKVDPRGIITTVAGSGDYYGDSGDGGLALKARLSLPFGVSVGRDGTVFIADTGNNRLREITSSGRILALAGTGHPGLTGDGGPARQAEFSGPTALTLDASGDLFVADTDNHRIRELPLLSR